MFKTTEWSTVPSMGPLFFRAENPALPRPNRRCGIAFNGAALFQSGELASVSPAFSAPVSASMGPLFFRAENEDDENGIDGGGDASMGPLFFRAENNTGNTNYPITIKLQWGRSFSERRTCRDWQKGCDLQCFNGAALFQSGEPAGTVTFTNGIDLLQWGRSFSERRTRSSGDEFAPPRTASMGPLFFRAENERSAAGTVVGGSLQWGRSFSERRTSRRVGGTAPGSEASMGPLFFRAENTRRTSVDCRGAGFNGAALFQSGEHRVGVFGVPFSGASMGPLFFRAENVDRVVSRNVGRGGFNGAALFQSGEQDSRATIPVAFPRLQWGRSFSERRTFPGTAGPGSATRLQWGRSFSERRTESMRACSLRSSTGFNGAALFQSGERRRSSGFGIAA